MEKVRTWVAQFIADYMIVQMLSSPPAAYLAGGRSSGLSGPGGNPWDLILSRLFSGRSYVYCCY